MAIEGIGDAIEGSSAARHARRFVPEIVPEEPMPWVLPREWLAPLAGA